MKFTAVFLAALSAAPALARVVHSYNTPEFQVERAENSFAAPDYTVNYVNRHDNVDDWKARAWRAQDEANVETSAAEDVYNTLNYIAGTIFEVKAQLISLTLYNALVVVPRLAAYITGTIVVAFVRLTQILGAITIAFTVEESNLIFNAFNALVTAFVAVLQIFVDKRSLFSGFLLAPLVKTIYLALIALEKVVFVALNLVVNLLAVAIRAKAAILVNTLQVAFQTTIRVYYY